ncbi:trypsin-like peptidase domain-containing protein [Streptomyces sp. NPDC059009]|uniref:trypsin-like peptidase domain-containing protein n=1 Tax=Streptomyces sp. NPDC059009 TaxID=3346694 RepID=UPI0036744C98
MDQGKPTKAKWWSRPRAQAPGAPEGMDTPPPVAGPEEPPMAGPGVPSVAGPGAPLSAGADVPLTAGPDASPAVGAEGSPAAGSDVSLTAGRDVPFAAGTEGAPVVGPEGTPTAGPEAPFTARADAISAQDAIPPQGTAPHADAAPHSDTMSASTPADAAPRTPAPTPADTERPRPLHDPDPYSTPPYGEPGPWAPAPPVQHPVATPAHGTQLPPQAPQPPAPQPPAPAVTTPTHGTHLPPQAPQPQLQPQPLAPQAPQPPQPQPQAQQPPAPAPAPAPAWQGYDPWNANAPLQQNGALPPPSKEKRQRSSRRIFVTYTAVVAIISGLIGGVAGAYLERDGSLSDVQLDQPGAESKARPKESVAGIAARSLPGVVTLHVRGDDGQGTGTGFVLDGKGHILTNNHVVEPAAAGGDISVTFSGGQSAKAKVVGRDTGYDLAVVKVSGVRGLRPLPLGNSENVQVGDPVVAIGAPFDLENTVTSGIISAKERPITAGGEKGDGSDISYVDALQTDAPINPGNSGGPLVDSQGRVIGINSAIRSADSGSQPEGGQAGSIGLGFAIPVNQGKRVAEELINTGKATHPVIGVTLDMQYSGDGARVAAKGNTGGPAVNRGGPGDRAGIKPRDVITEVDGQRVHSGEELIVKVRAHRPKDSLQLTVERGGAQRKVTLVLGASDGG